MQSKNNSLESALEEIGYILIDFKGTSMLPMLKTGRDRVEIYSTNERLKRGDIALYKRADGTYVLHRVMRVENDSYVFCGDNHYFLEYGVKDCQILGVMRGYYKGEKHILLDKSFCYFIYKNTYARYIWLRKVLRFPKAVIKKIFRIGKSNSDSEKG